MGFNYFEKDGTRDIYYELSFTEYKDLNIPAANNNKPMDENTAEETAGRGHAQESDLAEEGRGLSGRNQEAYGDYNHWRRVVKSNNLGSLVINNAGRIGKILGKKL